MKIDIDLSSGKVALECAEERLKEVMAEVHVFLPILKASLVQSADRESRLDVEPDIRNSQDERKTRRRKKAASNLAGPPSPPRRSSSSRIGPKAAIGSLITSGYFNQPRLISDVRGHLKHKTGTDYKPEELSVSLVRLMREERLDRNQNADGQYEYSEHK